MHLSLFVSSLVLQVVIGDDDEYQFRYRVKDQETGQDFGQEEERLGDDTGGEYQVLLPDGRTQIVRYRASDPSGFIANVEYQGEVTIPESPMQSLRSAKKLRPAVETINLAGRSPVSSTVTKQIIAPRVLPSVPATRIVPNIQVSRFQPSLPSSRAVLSSQVLRKVPRLVPTSLTPRGIPVAPRTSLIKAPSPLRLNPSTKLPARINQHVARKEIPSVVIIDIPKLKTLPSVIIPQVIKKNPIKAVKMKIKTKTKSNPKLLRQVVSERVLPNPKTSRKPMNIQKQMSSARITKMSSEQNKKDEMQTPMKNLARSSKSRKIVETKLPAPLMPKKRKSTKPSERKEKGEKKTNRKDIARSSKSRKTIGTKLPAPLMPNKIQAIKPSQEKQKDKKLGQRTTIARSSKSRKPVAAKLPAVLMPKKSKVTKPLKHVATRSTTENPVVKLEKKTESPEYKPSSEPPKMEYKDSDHVASSSKVLNSLFREDIKGMMNNEGEEDGKRA